MAGTPAEDTAAEYRRVEVPHRRIDEAFMVARPSDGGPVLLPATAATIWHALASWSSPGDLVESLIDRFPSIPSDQRVSAVEQVLQQLEKDGLVERR